MADKEAKKPVMDVEKPGTTPASATSRPIIISKGPAIKDPMVNGTNTDAEEGKDKQPALPLKKKTIQPLSEQPKEETDGSEPDTGTTESPKEEIKPEPSEQSPSEAVVPELDASEETEKPASAGETPEISEEDRKRQELVEKLMVSKKYFVPIGAAAKKRTARNTTLLFVVFLLIVSGAVLAIDAEIIQTNISLPFDLIK